ncbi:helix-turn-helix domain-containing protein [Algihabitans albus]|uniref:helix-turn-helix domain-containing protein n=1 Tax=Algihabitans albus TaxID=2164067 RepID=UPI000E5C7C54|nr:AraC family transcriptional regulator [Algihabitans albus]
MAELVAPEDLPKWVPGKILSRSDDLDWRGVALRSYLYKGQDVQIPAMRDFMLVSYRTGVTPMQRRFDGRWSRTTCGPGAVSLLTRSQKSHWYWTEDVEVTHVYLSHDLVSDVASEVTGRPVEDVSLADVLRTDDPIVTAAMTAIATEAADSGVGGALYVESVARQLVIHLLRNYATIKLRPRERSGELTTAQRRCIVEFIDAHLQDGLDLEAMAAEVNLSVSSFARHFKRSLGSAPYAYVIERRLERARRLLAETGRSVKDVAAICGFADQAHLTRLFARHYGTTPSVFRKMAGHRGGVEASFTG